MNVTFKGKKWKKADYSRMYKGWFISWMLHEKNISEQQSEQIWQDKSDLLTEYSNNPVRPSKKFEKFLELSTNNL